MIEAPQDPTERPRVRRLRSQLPNLLRCELAAEARAENSGAARKILLAAKTARRRATELHAAGHQAELVAAMAASEVARVLTCSHRVAETTIGIGTFLLDRAPLLREAFLTGDLDHRRIAAVVRVLTPAPQETVTHIEEAVIAAAHRMTPGPLEREVEHLLLQADPDGAETGRRMAAAQRRTALFPRAYGMSVFHAFLTADEAQRVAGAVDRIAGTACRHDPRTADTRRADALVALAEGATALACRCARPGCPATDPGPRPGRSVPHVFVHIDLATLIRLSDDPAVLAGYGPIAPEYARLLADNATWQLFITEGRTLAEHWATVNSPTDAGTDGPPHAGPPHGSPPASVVPSESDPLDGAITDPPPDDEIGDYLDPDYEEFLIAQYERQQRRRRAERDEARRICAVPPDLNPGTALGRARPAPPMLHPPPCNRIGAVRPILGQSELVTRIIDRLATDPDFRAGLYSDGHGGFAEPPPGALTYRPSARVRTAIQARDGHCRYPGCAVPAEICEIDHVVPFDHSRPRRGGWTVPANLQCLCRLHHRFKTDRYATVVMLPGAAQWWIDGAGVQTVTVPGGRRTRFSPPTGAPAPTVH